MRMPMARLDSIGMQEVSKRILQPARLKMLLDDYLQSAIERDDRNQHQLRQLRHEHKEADAGLARLLDLVEKGLMEVEDAALRERMVSLKFRRDERSEEHTSELQSLMRISYAVF